MNTQPLSAPTSGQIDPKCKSANRSGAVKPFIIDGCTVSFSSSKKATDSTMKTVKEILLSAYRTKSVRG